MNAWRVKNYQRYLARRRKYLSENRAKLSSKRRSWGVRNAKKVRDYNRKWLAAHPERVEEYKRIKDPRRYWGYQLKRDYGMTVEDYERRLAKQEGACALCGLPPRPGTKLVVDHDHKTHKVRGLVHRYCNHLLHVFDDQKKFRRFLAYVKHRD